MKLSQMHDLGGCRAILSDIESVRSVENLYRKKKKGSSQDIYGIKIYDYISSPKADGYRGVHIVGRYHSNLGKNEPWNGHRIEVQLRSQLQHAFATAVETATTFTRSPLKFGSGHANWRRFFALMGSALAIRENSPLVPGTPTDKDELLQELAGLNATLRVRERLRAWTDAITQLPVRAPQDANWLLLVLDIANNTVEVTGYSNRLKAAERVAELETSENSKNLDAVLVWVKSIIDLREAFPNYYADTTAFVEALNTALEPIGGE